MYIISVVAQKGGVGKSTLTIHWAVAAQEIMGLKVAIVDLDVQGSVADWYEDRKAEDLAVFSVRSEDYRDGDEISVKDIRQKLRQAVAHLDKEGYDLVFIDSPAKIGGLTEVAVSEANFAVVPVGPTRLDLKGVAATVNILHKSQVSGFVVVNKGRHSSNINDVAKRLLAKGFGIPVCPTVVMNRAILADAFNDGRTVLEVEPEGKAAHEIIDSWKWIAKNAHIQPKKQRRAKK